MPNSTLPFTDKMVDYVLDNITLSKIHKFVESNNSKYKLDYKQHLALLERIAILRKFCQKAQDSRGAKDTFTFSPQDVMHHFYSKQLFPVQKIAHSRGLGLFAYQCIKYMVYQSRLNSFSYVFNYIHFLLSPGDKKLEIAKNSPANVIEHLSFDVLFQHKTFYADAAKCLDPSISEPLLKGFNAASFAPVKNFNA